VNALDRLYLARAYELAARAIGNTSPNPAVGAVIVREGRILGEGYHHRAGESHAEVEALYAAGDARGATAYVSLEPCDHTGRTPPCAVALIDAGITRVVVGAADPNPRTDGGGIARLRASGIDVDVLDDDAARAAIDIFGQAIRSDRPFVALKMAMSLDGYVASKRGVSQWLTGEPARRYVRDLRIRYDAVMVGAGTVRIDDPQLTVRPPHHRLHPYARVIVCETDSVPESSRVFENTENYAPTIVLAPARVRKRFSKLAGVARLMFVGGNDAARLDLVEALRALRAGGIQSVLCEGGPTLAARLVAAGIVDRFYWFVAPKLLAGANAVPVLTGADSASVKREPRFESIERLGEDAVVSGTFRDV
jgi:diaminohydroxyphosphoribosylaminopyrimidine deaminase/5-amino-6-(5-phosphoribosylamino)uracil reductase